MRFIEQGTPAFEGFISGSDPIQIPGNRVFEDTDGERWFEVEPGIFAYHPGQTRAQAQLSFERVGYGVTSTLGQLAEDYPDGKLTRE